MTSGRAESRGAPRGSDARPPAGGGDDACAGEGPSRSEAAPAVPAVSAAGGLDERAARGADGPAARGEEDRFGAFAHAGRAARGEDMVGAGEALREPPRCEGEPSARAAAEPSVRAVVEPLRRADAIVVLGCRVQPWGRLTAAAEGRAAAAAEAWRAGLAPRIVTSGGRRWGAQIEAVALRDALVGRGVPAAAILVELWSMTTYENAVFSAALLRRLGARAAVVVTCSWHAPRALMSFRSAGVEATAWPRDVEAGAFDRIAEGVRRAVDARTIRRSTVLSRTAATFFRPEPPRSP